jgi:hypothetical protein
MVKKINEYPVRIQAINVARASCDFVRAAVSWAHDIDTYAARRAMLLAQIKKLDREVGFQPRKWAKSKR